MKNERRQTFMVMTFVFLLAAAGFGVMAWEDYNFLRLCKSTIGRVLNVERQKSGSSKAAGDTNVVTFSYEVDGNVYHGQQKMDVPPNLGPATVYYLPADPLKSRVQLPTVYGDLLIVFACAVGASIFGRKFFRKKNQPPRMIVNPHQ